MMGVGESGIDLDNDSELLDCVSAGVPDTELDTYNEKIASSRVRSVNNQSRRYNRYSDELQHS